MVDDEPEDEPEPIPHDPTRGMRRLALAIVLQACLDFTTAQNRDVWSDANNFLFPDDPDQQEFLRWTVECSSLDPYRLRANLIRVRQQMAPRLTPHAEHSRRPAPARTNVHWCSTPGFQPLRLKPITAEFHTCQQCGVLPVTEFNINRHSAAGLTDLCRRCISDKTRTRCPSISASAAL
jgi:hypothetical protein